MHAITALLALSQAFLACCLVASFRMAILELVLLFECTILALGIKAIVGTVVHKVVTRHHAILTECLVTIGAVMHVIAIAKGTILT